MPQKPTPLLDEQALIQLAEMETLITQYLRIYAENTGSYDFDFSVFDPTLRTGLVSHRRGRGWKLHRTWRERLAQKRQALTGELLGATLR